MKNGGRKGWVLPLVLLAGVLIGGILWQLLLKVLPAGMDVNIPIGTTTPFTLDLSLVVLTLGAKINVNPGSAAGLIAGLAFYFWRR